MRTRWTRGAVGAPAAAATPVASDKASPGSGELASPFLRSVAPRPADAGVPPRAVGRSPHTLQRLHRLRRELAKIGRSLPLPRSPAHAREHVLDALARAGLGEWTVPSLDDPKTMRCPDGSCGIPLLSHVIWLNPWGAFRIVDLRQPSPPYFEVSGEGQRAFVMPPAA